MRRCSKVFGFWEVFPTSSLLHRQFTGTCSAEDVDVAAGFWKVPLRLPTVLTVLTSSSLRVCVLAVFFFDDEGLLLTLGLFAFVFIWSCGMS